MLNKEQINEIRMMYKEAKNKKRQIGILAQLYACSCEEIREAIDSQVTDKKEEEKKAKTAIHPTRCQPGKTADVWKEEKQGSGVIENALQQVLDEFDRNEQDMKKIMQKMIPLAAEYKEIELRQQGLVNFIENFCKINEKKTT